MSSRRRVLSRPGVRTAVRRWAAVLVVAALPALPLLPGCSGGITGKYVAEGQATGNSGMTFTLELASGGVATMTLGGFNGQSMPPVVGTWTADGDKITTVLDDDRDEMTLKDGTLTLDFFDEKLVLKKQ